jgi:DNA-binding transcriptional ArsR family regulator
VELTQNLWERFGFRDNPYDTRALSFSENALLPIAKAFIGREMDSKESRVITNFFRNPGGGRIVVEGDVGVGKTTFVNYHRFLWEHEAQDRLLTPSSEISVYSTWTAQAFVMSVLGSLVGRFLVLKGKKWVHEHDLLSEVAALTHVYIERSLRWSGSLTVFGTGVGGSRATERAMNVPDVGMPQLISYLEQLSTLAHDEGFAGITLHFDNMELLMQTDPEALGRFFDEIRDVLQTPGYYFVFVAPGGFFQTVIVPRERVRSIFFGQPVVVPPLSEDEVLAVLQRRYELLATEPGHWVSPVSDELVVHLYALFDGKIRFVMDAIQNIVAYVPEGLPGTISDDMALEILTALANERVSQLLTPTEQEVLAIAAGEEEFNNALLTELTDKRKQNIATYIEKYMRLGLVRRIRQEGNEIFYEVAPDVRPLAVVEAQRHEE